MNFNDRFIHRLQSKDSTILIWFLLISILLRILSFFYSVIDHDESTYLLIGREIARGSTLYTDVWDTKPPGIYLIFAFFNLLFGNSIFIMRLVAALTVGLTAFMLYKAKLQLSRKKGLAIASGILYVIATSAYRFGLAANTEIFFNLFTITGLFLLLKNGNIFKYLLAGFILGLGFIIKYVTIFDLTAFIIFYLFLYHELVKVRKSFKQRFFNTLITGISFVIPFGLINIYYLIIDQYDTFFFVSFEFISRYKSSYQNQILWNYILDFHIKFFPLLFVFYFIILKKIREFGKNPSLWLSVIWFSLVFTGIMLQGKPFNHYFIQIIPALCFLAPDVTEMIVLYKNISNRIRNQVIAGISILILLTAIINQSYYLYTPDYPRQITRDLKNEIQGGDFIFTTNYLHIIYYLMDTDIPTKYVHPSLIILGKHITATGINPAYEIRQIMRRKPIFIIIKDSFYMYDSQKDFEKFYLPYKTYDEQVTVYRLIF